MSIMGFYGLAAAAPPRSYAPTPAESAAVDQWIRASSGFGSRSVSPWQLGADSRMVMVPTDNGSSVRFGFGSGVLAAFGSPGGTAPPAAAPAPSLALATSAPAAPVAVIAAPVRANQGTPLEASIVAAPAATRAAAPNAAPTAAPAPAPTSPAAAEGTPWWVWALLAAAAIAALSWKR